MLQLWQRTRQGQYCGYQEGCVVVKGTPGLSQAQALDTQCGCQEVCGTVDHVPRGIGCPVGGCSSGCKAGCRLMSGSACCWVCPTMAMAGCQAAAVQLMGCQCAVVCSDQMQGSCLSCCAMSDEPERDILICVGANTDSAAVSHMDSDVFL